MVSRGCKGTWHQVQGNSQVQIIQVNSEIRKGFPLRRSPCALDPLSTLAKGLLRHISTRVSYGSVGASELFTALVAEFGITQVFGAALGARLGLGFLLGRMAAPGAKLGVRCEILAATGTLGKYDLLVTALGAELRRGRNGALAFRAR